MRAILLSKGKERDIYFLEEVKDCIEVQDYFAKFQDNRGMKGYIAAFTRYLGIVKDDGFNKLIKGHQWKSWPIGDDKFYEFISGPE